MGIEKFERYKSNCPNSSRNYSSSRKNCFYVIRSHTVQLFARRVTNLTMVTVDAQDCYHIHREFQYFPSTLIPYVDETTEDAQCDFQCKRPTIHKISAFLKG